MWDKLAKFGTFLSGAGGLASAFSGGPSTSLYRKQLKQSQAQFDAQMDETIQRRVADAMAAGIHPLFAMGGSGVSPTITSGSAPLVPRSGSRAGDAISSLGRTLAALPNQKAARELDEAQAAYYNALAKKAEQGVNSGPRTYPYGAERGPGHEGWHEIVPPQVPASQKPGVRAGNVPETIRVRTKNGSTMDIPNPELGLDEIGQISYARQKSVAWLSSRIEDMASAVQALGSPSDRDVARLQRQLDWLKANPQKAREAQALYEKWRKWLRRLVRR